MGLTTAAFMVGSAAYKAVGSYNGAKAQKSALNSEAVADQQNAKIAEWEASQAIQNGQTEEESKRLEIGGLVGRERAAMGASGTDLGYGSNTDILTTTKVLGERDALQIRDNALRTAWGYRTEGTGYGNKASMAAAGASSVRPWASGLTSLLGSAASSGFSFGGMEPNFSWAGPGNI
jgi:hypothetical protein